MQRASGTGDIQISTSFCVRSSQSAVVARTVAIAVLVEALLLAFAGAVVGAAVAYTVFNGTTISTLGGAVWDSQLVCSLNITPSLMVVAVVLACTLGLLVDYFPLFAPRIQRWRMRCMRFKSPLGSGHALSAGVCGSLSGGTTSYGISVR